VELIQVWQPAKDEGRMSRVRSACRCRGLADLSPEVLSSGPDEHHRRSLQ